MDKHLLKAAALAAILALTACSDAPKPPAAEAEKKESAGPSGPVTAKVAFYEMYKHARSWATDVQPLSIASKDVPGVKNEPGKAAMWMAIFGSPSLHQVRTFYYAVVDQGAHITKGVRDGGTQAWSGPTTQAMPFQISEFHIDSDAAYKTAAEDGAAWIKAHPDKAVSMSLGNATRFPAPMWYVLWGDNKAGYAAYVSTVTGSIMKHK